MLCTLPWHDRLRDLRHVWQEARYYGVCSDLPRPYLVAELKKCVEHKRSHEDEDGADLYASEDVYTVAEDPVYAFALVS